MIPPPKLNVLQSGFFEYCHDSSKPIEWRISNDSVSVRAGLQQAHTSPNSSTSVTRSNDCSYPGFGQRNFTIGVAPHHPIRNGSNGGPMFSLRYNFLRIPGNRGFFRPSRTIKQISPRHALKSQFICRLFGRRRWKSCWRINAMKNFISCRFPLPESVGVERFRRESLWQISRNRSRDDKFRGCRKATVIIAKARRAQAVGITK